MTPRRALNRPAARRRLRERRTDTGGPPDGGPGPSDARVTDAPMACTVRITLMPAEATAPATISATAGRRRRRLTTVTWAVEGPGGTGRDVAALDAAGLRVSFLADVEGVYTVAGTARVNGRACLVVPAALNVRAANARRAELRLRYLPPPGQGASRQDDPTPVTVYGGGETMLAAPRGLAALDRRLRPRARRARRRRGGVSCSPAPRAARWGISSPTPPAATPGACPPDV